MTPRTTTQADRIWHAHLLSGKSLGRAATAARRALADNPTRQIGPVPVALQDWAVPVVEQLAPIGWAGAQGL